MTAAGGGAAVGMSMRRRMDTPRPWLHSTAPPPRILRKFGSSLRTAARRRRYQHAMERKGAGRAVAEAIEAPLRLEHAFVVQLRDQPDPAANLFVGRAEHLVSGMSERFTCAADLLAFITKVLACRGGPR